ncbi:MAG: DUF721 domain-containing protein [Bacteroidales bacterium]|nr:DUF721 domain-containing protein [Bacteroidales bacterium]
MKRTEAETVGQIISRLLKAENLEGKFDEQRVAAIWPEVVGQGINRYTVNRYVRSGVLHVTIASAPLRNELMLNRSRLVARINDFIGHTVIHDVVFH